MVNKQSLLRSLYLTVTFITVLCGVRIAVAANLPADRTQFLNAWHALQQGNYSQFIALSNSLKNYPLYPYLQSADIEFRLKSLDSAKINGFLQQYANTPLADQLYARWFRVLADQQRWADIKKYYRPAIHNVGAECLYRLAHWHTGEQAFALTDLAELWLTGSVLPKTCDPLFHVWRQQKGLTPNLVWQRIGLAMKSGNTKLATTLSSLLPPANQKLVNLWVRVYEDPRLMNSKVLFQTDNNQMRDIIAFGLARLAKKDAAMSARLWQQFQIKHAFSAQQQGEVIHAVALHLATERHPEAQAWLAKVPPTFVDQPIREWRIRVALTTQRWSRVRYYIATLPKEEQTSLVWRYWWARSLAELGVKKEAKMIFRELATQRNYYGFLASAWLGQTCNIQHVGVPATDAELATVARHPGLARAYEFYQLHWLDDARREWHYALQNLSQREMGMAAKLARQWSWYDCAIVTAGKSGYLDDLVLRFPLVYRDYVTFEAKQQQLDPAWIFAIIRQESIFMKDAKSSAGAVGLMQLMPSTAKMLSNSSQRVRRGEQLSQAGMNIHLGSYYLRQMFSWFNKNMVLATASYNAGPGRVHKWIPKNNRIAADVWIETIPWKETREYVKNVLAFTAVYQAHLSMRPDLAVYLQPIKG